MQPENFVADVALTPKAKMDWGQLAWFINNEVMPGAKMTMGLVTIQPGQRNPLHSHPNCEEILYVLSGSCDHKLGDQMFRLTRGQAIRIPTGVKHWAKSLGDEPLVALVAFSSGDRRTNTHEDGGPA